MANQPGTWYENWFNTPFYHSLYKDRDYTEARHFMESLTEYLGLEKGASILDLGCGRGRHSIHLSEMGFEVTGVDLSVNNITEAQKSTRPGLDFKVHDMRIPMGKQYDAVFNLFTSFGYFDNDSDNLVTLKAIQQNLNEYGLAVLDFLNVDYVLANLVKEEVKEIDGISFHIERYLKDDHIFKEIRFQHQGQDFHFTERVKAFHLSDFERMMEENDMYLLEVFGNYKLQKFHPELSPRLILIFK